MQLPGFLVAVHEVNDTRKHSAISTQPPEHPHLVQVVREQIDFLREAACIVLWARSLFFNGLDLSCYRALIVRRRKKNFRLDAFLPEDLL